ncbi:MAG: phosphodiester glycosidase family protein, partial [Anaerovorax sp.]
MILSAAMDSPYGAELAQLVPGTSIEVTATNSGSTALNDSMEAMGVYYVLYENGKYITPGTNVNPRTCVGIKPDGSVMMLAIDGRQSGWSAGLGLTEAAEYLVSLGCTVVVNMDGGGSTTLASRLPGKEATATLKNSPSGGTQRAVTNGLFFVYQGTGDKQVQNLHTYVGNSLVMPGADVKLSTFASDSMYEPVPLPGGVSYSVESDKGTVNGSGVFTAGKTAGKAVIVAQSGEKSAKTTVEIFDGITFNTNEQKLFVDPGKTADINVAAYRGYAPVASKDSLFTFKCDEKIGTIDENGVFTARNQGGLSGNIVVSYKDKVKNIPVQVGSPLVEFADTKTHWAKEYIGKLAARGVVNGMGNNLYLPESTLTRAQFLTML